jgi:hypothetical protein
MVHSIPYIHMLYKIYIRKAIRKMNTNLLLDELKIRKRIESDGYLGCKFRVAESLSGAACTILLSCRTACIAVTAPITCTLSPVPATGDCHFSAAQRRPLALDSGTDPRALSVRGRGICRHAGTHSPARHRTRGRDAVRGDASVKTARRAPCCRR